jgi:hypothetical protein
MAQQQNTGMQMPKISYASTMMIEDHLKRCLAKTSNKPFKTSNNKLLPKAQHSAFGDFPAEFKVGKKTAGLEPEPIDRHEQSIAAKGTCKINHKG